MIALLLDFSTHDNSDANAVTYRGVVVIMLGLNWLDTSVLVFQSIDISLRLLSIFLRYLHLGD